jgi:predicted DNA-binding antitoxin AbrB/MazE fold protein
MSHDGCNGDIIAIYDQGVFRPLVPLVLPEGTRVHLHVEEQTEREPGGQAIAHIRSPRLVHPEQAAEFVMESEANKGLVDWLLACPEKDWFQALPSESTDTLS